jgi:hypothetical protein
MSLHHHADFAHGKPLGMGELPQKAPPMDPRDRLRRFGPIRPMAEKRSWLERILFSEG